MSPPLSANYPSHLATIKKLSESAWQDAKITRLKVDRWLSNFKGEATAVEMERLHAMHLLAQHIFIGRREIDECLRVLFEERIAYPFVQKHKDSLRTADAVNEALQRHLCATTRFVGMGNPAESGTSLLYRFRQVNRLPLKVFSTPCDAVEITADETTHDKVAVLLEPPELNHLIFLDDFCGSGTQATRRVKKLVKALRSHQKSVRVSYFLLFSTQSGLDALESSGLFDEVRPVIVFDEDYKAFCSASHYYRSALNNISREVAEQTMEHYGKKLVENPDDALGFGECQLLMSFEHNTPNNTLPVIWADQPEIPWHAIFPRVDKIE
ncbi:MAG: hypothetical protein JNM99_10115 [Verrucomicrobiaceae bacterium]|nr:hypothetical protein [Verrucomicrobiaceae bacterium]